MSTKVLVFESDPAFAGELRSELGKLGCSTTVVEDGNVGLQQAGADKPDLILLSIELPRMNGFSVCNKLKKDAGLKDVPLIIMSSESSDETFEQHKKLRTRAEDYVHKPIAFGELLQHIQGFVEIGAGVGAESEAIVIEEDIESSDYLVEEDGPMASAAAASAPARSEKVDADVDAFAESAFGRLTEPEAPPPPAGVARNGATESRAPRKSALPPPAAARSVRPHAPSGVDPVEHEKLRDDLTRAKERITGVEGELAEAKAEAEKLRMEAGEAERLGHEVDELKAKLAAGAKGGAISSREFLDLREALNKKDKEILTLREHLSKKDKEIIESQEKGLVLERSKADLDDRLLALERDLDETKEKSDALAADKEQAKKASDDFKSRFEKSKVEGEAKDKQLAELRAKLAADVTSLEVKLAATRSDFDQTLANERADHARALDEAEDRRKADLEQAKRDEQAALAEARERSEEQQKSAAATRSAELQKEHDEATATLMGAQDRALAAVRAEAAEAVSAAEKRREDDVAQARKDGSEEVARARKDAEDQVDKIRREAEERITQARAEVTQHEEVALEALKKEHLEKVAAVENDRDARIATLESKGARELAEANDKLAKIEVEHSGVRGELESLRETKRTEDEAHAMRTADLERRLGDLQTARDALDKDLAQKKVDLARETSRADKAMAKWDADKRSLERAKDALAVALSQIEETDAR